MNALLEHINDNTDAILDNPNELLYLTKEEQEDCLDEAIIPITPLGAAGAAGGGLVGSGIGTITARSTLQFKDWKAAIQRLKKFKARPHKPRDPQFQRQLQKLEFDLKEKRAAFVVVRNRSAGTGARFGAVVGGVVGTVATFAL